ncbi:MAG: phosphate acyltransferase, partial [Proteobacteria bacterium]|nr:phosphate acyltransferase [Pseudomonadota bacterium]
GLRGIVFKSHGSADAYAFRHALERAAEAASRGLNQRISQALLAG